MDFKRRMAGTLIMALLLALTLTGCGGSDVNENVLKAIDVLMNAPNDDIPDSVILGEGVDDDGEGGSQAEALKDLLGGCVAEDSFNDFFANSPDAMLIQGYNFMSGIGVSVKDVSLKEETEDSQTVTVELDISGMMDISADLTFGIDADGLLTAMTFDDAYQLTEDLVQIVAPTE